MDKLKSIDKRIWISFGAISVIIIIIFTFILSKKDILVLKDTFITSEYGQAISDNPSDYLILKDKSLVSKIKVDNNIEYEENEMYPKLGKYKIKFSYKDESVTVTIEVKDTTKPTFNNCNSVEFVKGTDFDYGEFIKAGDLQEVTYDFDTSKVDKDRVGEYTVKVTAIDKSNNKAEKEIQVKVLDVDTTNNDVQTTVNESGNVVVNVTEKPKETTNNTTSHSTSNAASNNASTGGNTNSSNNNAHSSNNSSSNSNTPNTIPTPPQAETPHQHVGIALSPLFNTKAECDKWAEDYLDNQSFPWKYHGYGAGTCSCGKWRVTNFY